ncbi:suppressor of fused domain protein [bacterium M00.F.Ca.ET.230.01.1.1]|nr:suppressor of fused domain protein [bacterium M00.F.Ca.ET.230.01.1.1]
MALLWRFRTCTDAAAALLALRDVWSLESVGARGRRLRSRRRIRSGVEFILASTEQGDWAIRCLQNLLAFDLLLGAGHFGGRGPLGEGDRIPLRSPINGVEGCEVRNVVVVRTPLLPSGFTLPSGRVEFFTFVGMTDRELDFAKESGNEALLTKLSSNGFFPVTDPRRQSVI